jgi:raffinose/stachyose/melibiose transport system substrate-binding protein
MHRRAALALGAGFAATAALRPAGAQAKAELNFLHKWPEPDNIAFFRQVVREFEAANPGVSIKMEAVADDPYKDKIRVVMASGNVPDIFFSWSGEYAGQFVRAGRTLDLTAALAAPEWKDRFAPATLVPFTFEGKVRGVPMNLSAKFLAYNKALFAAAGITAPPATFPELIAAMDKLKANNVVPIALGTQAPWAAAHYIGDWNTKLVPNDIRAADYSLAAPEDKLFTHPGYAQALTHFGEFASKGYFNRSPNALTHAIARGTFTAGRAAMFYEETLGFKNYAGTKLAADGWSFFKMPAFPDGAGDQGQITGAPDGFLVSAATKNPKEALAFLNFLTTRANGAAWTKVSGRPSAVQGAITEEVTLPEIAAGIAQLGQATGMALWLDTVIDPRVVGVYLPGMQAVLGGTETPQQVMDKIRAMAIRVKKERG